MPAASKSSASAHRTLAEITFPVDSFREAAPHLRRPFTPAAVKFKVQATWPKQNPTGGLIVSYIDARLVVERLNLIVPHLWHDAYEPQDRHLICHLTVDGITRSDVGEGIVKGLYSDALKRAAVKFGVGVSLYATPKMMLSVDDGHLKSRRTRDGESLVLTPKGESHVRFLYAKWLEAHGSHAFGEPLDHGDTEGAQGDVEAEDEELGHDGQAATTPSGGRSVQDTRQEAAVATPEQRRLLFAAADDAQLPPVEFADAICKAVGIGLKSFEDQSQASAWAARQVDRLPARLVDRVLDEIRTMATREPDPVAPELR